MPKLRKSRKDSNSLILTIPRDTIKRKDWKAGDEILVGMDDRTGKVTLEKINVPK